MKSFEPERLSTDGPHDMAPAAFQAPAARIAVTRGPDAGLSARIDRPTFVVGTGPTADLRLTDPAVSREHLRLALVCDGVHVRDAGSTNGVWMSTLRVQDVIVVRSTELLIGSTMLSLAIDGSPFEQVLPSEDESGEWSCIAPCRCRRSADVPGEGIEQAAEALAHLPYQDARAIVFEHFQRAYLPAVLARAGNVVVRAAKLAGVRRGSFHRMLRRIRRPPQEIAVATSGAPLRPTVLDA